MISSFFISDMISSKFVRENSNNTPDSKLDLIQSNVKFSQITILSIATMEWLTNDKHYSKQLMRIMYKYYLAHPDTSPSIYNKGLSNWLSNGAKDYRNNYDAMCTTWCGIIGFVAPDIREAKRLANRAVRATNNNPECKKLVEMVVLAIYLNTKFHSKTRTLKYLRKHYNYNPVDDIDNFLKGFSYTANVKDIVYAGFHCFFQTESSTNAIKYAIRLKYNCDIISCIAGLLAESLTNDIPQSLSFYYAKQLPQKFVETMFRFDDYHINKKTTTLNNTINQETTNIIAS